MYFLNIVCAFLFSAQSASAGPVDGIADSMLTRLEAAVLVAEAKYAAGRPVEDLTREAAVIEKAVAFAAEYGVDEALARRFFQAQMAANKSVQSKLINGWKAAGRKPLGTPPNLAVEVRPIYDALTPKLLTELKASIPVLQAEDGCDLLQKAEKKRRSHKNHAAFKLAIAPLVRHAGGDCRLGD